MSNLSTQIATTREQSERLLAMGVNPETCDCSIEQITDTDDWSKDNTLVRIIQPYMDQPAMIDFCTYFPAWSLSRLISMLPPFISGMKSGREPHHPELIKRKQGYVLSIRRYTDCCLVGTHIEKDPIVCCVSMIDWLIKNNHFNKEYLCLE